MFLERLAGGFAVLTAKDTTAPRAGTPEYFAMQTVLANLKGAAGLLVPTAWSSSSRRCRARMSSSGPSRSSTLASPARSCAQPSGRLPHRAQRGGTAGSGAGSQSQTQLEAFYWTLQEDQARLEAVLNEQLFKPLDATTSPMVMARASSSNLKR